MGFERPQKKSPHVESPRASYPDSFILRSGKELNLETAPEADILLERNRIKLLIERLEKTEPQEADDLRPRLAELEEALKTLFKRTFEKS